ncbi:MAG: MBL fold metallo-hydrolase [Candidatus Abyssobacteria bacterium SURF_17]|uniref:MBL fold metallo-hydrolase n=1 Tax=Candidatus Abyssobacteria bacterium SURF_17 TaxID=2093361 RepID=A0A419ETM0_9BACT|nr:MAG: MBL fold metallo-hydrolase [Candidatus Abyssubacteria bacterium SURF_17]
MKEIADRIFYIEGQNRGRYPDCHSLFVNDDVSVIIDPAGREDVMKQIAAGPGADVILNTHYHEDHRIYNYLFNDATLLVHELDARGYGHIDEFMSGFSVVNSPALKELWRSFLLETCKYRPYDLSGTFTDGFEIDLGHTTLRAVHTPGHSAGHCCFFFPREGIAYLGDIDLTLFGPWYASNNSDIDAFLQSIERLRQLRPRAVITSHGDGLITERVDERLKRYAEIIHQRDEAIMEFVTQPHTLEEVMTLEIVYRKNQKTPDAFFYWDDRLMIEMHLARLLKAGRLQTRGDAYIPAGQ